MNAILAISEENINLLALANIDLNLIRNGKNEFDIDSVQEAVIREIANDCPATLATNYAQAILRLVYGEEYTLALPNSNLKTDEETLLELSNDTAFFLGDNIPNPFDNTTSIPYYVPFGSKGFLQITDAKGKLIDEYALQQGKNKLEVSLEYLKAGTYFYSIIIDGIIKASKKMILE